MSSINQTGAAIRLPNFCNLGVMLRVRRANQQKRALQSLQTRLGDAVGAPTGDERLSIETAPGP
jgi:hypothetical protein